MPKTGPQNARDDYAHEVRRHGHGSPQAQAAQKRLAEANLTARIKKLVAEAPAFTPAQISELRVLLEPARTASRPTYDDAA